MNVCRNLGDIAQKPLFRINWRKLVFGEKKNRNTEVGKIWIRGPSSLIFADS